MSDYPPRHHPDYAAIMAARTEAEEDKLTRIFLLRSSNVTSIMIASLQWIDPPILGKHTRKINNIHSQDTWWIEGQLKLVVEDFLERKNLKIEKLLEILNRFEYPVVCYPNDLLESKLDSRYEPIIIDFTLPDELKASQQQEIRDILSILLIEKRIINNTGQDLTGALPRDNLAIAIRTFKRSLIAEIHNYTQRPYLNSQSI